VVNYRTVARKSSIGGLNVCAGGLERKNYIIIAFHISIWGIGTLFGGDKPTKAPSWRRAGQLVHYRTYALPSLPIEMFMIIVLSETAIFLKMFKLLRQSLTSVGSGPHHLKIY